MATAMSTKPGRVINPGGRTVAGGLKRPPKEDGTQTRPDVGGIRAAAVWWIPGNHDTDSNVDYDNLFGSDLAEHNLHGRAEVIAGFHVAGLSGVCLRACRAV